MLRRVAVGFGVVVLAAACGGYAGSRTPSGPSEPPPASPVPPPAPPQTVPEIGGAWTGTHEMQFDGTRTSSAISLTLAQTEREITGSWRLTSPDRDMRGDVTGTILGSGDTARFTGSATVIVQMASGGRCAGVAEMNSEGVLSARSMRWVGPHVRFTICQSSISALVWSLTR